MSNQDKLIISEEGLNKLKDELKHLRGPKRKEIAQRIKEARELGDISENSEYDDAKNEQAFVEGRIKKLENMIKNAEVINEDEIDTTEVNVGTTVRLLDKEFDEEVEYKIVSSAETNPDENKISNASPVGKGLLGHKVGDTVEIDIPAGSIEYEVLAIKK
ncbi:transcription elongation factor GreA [Halobacteroides halobius DSM 5150]|uniref:Transcription elongation factor GreA n=1 Tax=Halobacteroides halobius (strain ATCC 35273 / DSM 5150 / MD-1) TaxID=748449 RepID=L0K569_HALHC|nr:transcription elongation factor GreA [Halobacteroides halobius]AGB40161.1 transcription elongation factor GreA [Halobacteroides halobius DSM 5150]